jgi:hypothetical protein
MAKIRTRTNDETAYGKLAFAYGTDAFEVMLNVFSKFITSVAFTIPHIPDIPIPIAKEMNVNAITTICLQTYKNKRSN